MKDDDFGLEESLNAYEKKTETIIAQYEELRTLAAHQFVGKWITRTYINDKGYLLVEKVSRCDYDIACDDECDQLRKQDAIFKVDIITELTPTSISHDRVEYMQLLNGRWKVVPNSLVLSRAREYASAIQAEITEKLATVAAMQDFTGKN